MPFYSRGIEIMLITAANLQEELELAEEMLTRLQSKRIVPVLLAVDSGKSLREPYSMVSIFSPMFLKMITLGESSGYLSSSFACISTQNQESLKKIMG